MLQAHHCPWPIPEDIYEVQVQQCWYCAGQQLTSKKIVRNSVCQYKEFKCCFACQDPRKPVPTRNLYLNLKLYLFLKHIVSMFHFSWFLGCALSVDEQNIGFKLNRWINYNILQEKGGGVRWMLSDTEGILALFLEEWIYSKVIHIGGNFTFTCLCFLYF